MLNLNGKTFFVQWVTAVTITLTLAAMGAFISMWSIGEVVQQAWGDPAMALVVGVVFGGLLGVGVGLGQAIVLRTHGIRWMRWLGTTVLAAAMGMAIGFTVMFSFFDMDNMPEIVVGLVMALSFGVPIGLVQWQMLKSHLAQAQLWPPICFVAFFISFPVGLSISGEGREWLSLGVLALLTAVITGAGMVWMARSGETAIVV